MSDTGEQDAVAANRTLWDTWTGLHQESAFYHVEGFLAGRDHLNPVEHEELGDVRGLRFLHLQCHFGIDALGWARRGAEVTGVDFSARAMEAARELARRAGLEARFVQSDVHDLEAHDLGRFDGPDGKLALPEYNWVHDLPLLFSLGAVRP